MTLSYDQLGDVLYITFVSAPRGSYWYVEIENGDVLKVDKASNRVVGCTISSFKLRAAKGKIELPEITGASLDDATTHLVCA
jgi:uncharacterized protein YuzE